MAIDYSKWDKLELSDDSDIEVHPNVDKQSFIRWKQQDIHQKRAQRNQDILNLETQIPMYEELNTRVDQLLKVSDDEKLGNFEYVQNYLKDNFDTKSKPQNVEPDAPTHNEMIEDLFIQLKQNLEKANKDPNDGHNLRQEVLEHRKKIDEVLFNHKEKLKELYKERELNISSDDMHTGWDRSFLNKDGSKPAHTSTVSDASASAVSAKSTPLPPKTGTSGATSTATSAKSTAATTSTGNNELSAAQAHESSEEANLEDVHPDALEYSHLSTTDIVKIKAFLKSHTHIINPQQKDSLLMKAFDSQLEGNVPRTKQIIFLSTLLQYIYDIIEFKRARHPQEIQIIVEQLLGKMFTGAKNPALDAFEGEVGRTYQHIKERCEVISRESVEEGEGVEEIQLKSLDDSVELVVNLPNENSSDPKEVERYQIFKTLPESMQAALKTGQLDEVNKVFHGIPIDEAENILEIFDQCEVIGVQALIDNEADWKEIKNEYESQFGDENAPDPSKYHNVEAPKIEELDIKEERFETGDIVD